MKKADEKRQQVELQMKNIRAGFDEYVKKHPYESFLPADAQPPLEINEKLMNQYRPLMEEFYTNP